jgi:DNA mismatch endonuclease (patch repair protein)
MIDIVDAATRSRMMSGIRNRNTKPEIQIRSLLHRAGFRFRLHVRDLPGKPDIVLPRFKAAVLVHGCFWHGHDCALFRLPSTRREFWEAKIDRNRNNDRRAISNLTDLGWRVATIWECALKGRGAMGESALVDQISSWLRGSEATIEVVGQYEAHQ